ncbi:MAG TPA: hypothetical protein VMT00_04695 [Thermoanaerobaculia bacterium]|nr:hypothetical protein [Thermoanaerobaculia bacterium]
MLGNVITAEQALKQATEQLADRKKRFEGDLEVLRRLHAADKALVDSLQPSIAVQKAFEHVEEAERLAVEFVVKQGIIRARQALEDARRSPASADFERLRSVLRTEALGPASRLVARNALGLEEEVLAWAKLQESISAHLRALSEIAAESLRAALQ